MMNSIPEASAATRIPIPVEMRAPLMATPAVRAAVATLVRAVRPADAKLDQLIDARLAGEEGLAEKEFGHDAAD
jgi:hypothetical protein